MLDIDGLVLSAEQARAARNYFGLSQAAAAEESGLPLHKLKRFEARPAGAAGSYIPDGEFLEDLRSFYEKRGFHFDDTHEPGARAKKSGLVFPAGVVGSPEEGADSAEALGRPVRASFHHMRIALAEPDMGHVLDLIEENEARVHALLNEPVSAGFFDGFSDRTEAQHGAITKLLAVNGILFAKLFGRATGGIPSPEMLSGQGKPKTQAQLLHRVHADALLAASGDVQAKDRLSHRQPANTLSAAIFG